jgi:hypothetical protein
VSRRWQGAEDFIHAPSKDRSFFAGLEIAKNVMGQSQGVLCMIDRDGDDLCVSLFILMLWIISKIALFFLGLFRRLACPGLARPLL